MHEQMNTVSYANGTFHVCVCLGYGSFLIYLHVCPEQCQLYTNYSYTTV